MAKGSALTKIVLTGGPCAGKTSVAEILRREFAKNVLIVSESASVLYKGGFHRAASKAEMKVIQRAIYYVQDAAEDFAYLRSKRGQIVLCDRGTLDGAAYWPGSREDFCKSLKTTIARELGRYDLVIHMESAKNGQGYGHFNSERTESATEARDLDRRVQRAWAGHPMRFVVKSRNTFMDKVDEVLSILRSHVPHGL
jgi:thymidylate kinase